MKPVPRRWLLIPLSLLVISAAALLYSRFLSGPSSQLRKVISWINNPTLHPEWMVQSGRRCSATAPFLIPTDGFIGFLWQDSFRPGHTHQGIDIFAPTGPGVTPVYSVYPGYLTRLTDWKSSLIIRIPEDPLSPGRQIWTYYTHLADPEGKSYILDDFPPGTSEMFVEEGTLLGYQGNYSGTEGNPVGVHLHFSIVLDDGQGRFLNELQVKNTLDPSPYFDLPLNRQTNSSRVPVCPSPEP